MKKILVLGATGAMGQYLVPQLAEMGYAVDGVSLVDAESTHANIRYLKGNVSDLDVLNALLANRYDAIVDFLIYNTALLAGTLPKLLERTSQYIYLSSYRIYDNKEVPIKETSPRLIDSSEDALLRNSDDYCIYKARGENILKGLKYKNWTIIRPAITYSYMRYQLVTLEAANTVGRAFAGKQVVLPIQARDIQGTMSWAGDIPAMIARLLFNEKAMCETFTVATAEHHTWGEIADYYKEICNLDALWVDQEDYIKILNPNPYSPGTRWQLAYDRLFDREMDNTKILSATKLKQADLMTLYDGLKYEISRCPRDYPFSVNASMDAYLSAMTN